MGVEVASETCTSAADAGCATAAWRLAAVSTRVAAEEMSVHIGLALLLDSLHSAPGEQDRDRTSGPGSPVLGGGPA